MATYRARALITVSIVSDFETEFGAIKERPTPEIIEKCLTEDLQRLSWFPTVIQITDVVVEKVNDEHPTPSE